MRLDGVDGSELLGFMAALGTLSLLDRHARSIGRALPKLRFARDGVAEVLDGGLTEEVVAEAAFEQLQSSRPFFEKRLAAVKRPSDFDRETFAAAAARATRGERSFLAGLACCVGADVYESTLCAANGASHQNLVQSIRDILSLVERDHLRAALFAPWRRGYEVAPTRRKQLDLGTRKPTLRLDPADERLYALRLANPTTTDDFKTELGAQALAIPAFALLPVLPRHRRPVSVASFRQANKVYFSWTLWDVPADLHAVRSHVCVGVSRSNASEARARGAFAAYRVARVSGEKGKLSFSPAEGLW